MERNGLAPDALGPDPRRVLEDWLKTAVDASLPEPTAMTLATADASGAPSARMVLLKSIDAEGLLFSTNYESRKARELDENPRAAVVLFWQPLNRQVRVEGAVERATAEESDAIFHARPRDSRISAWSSQQSAPLAGRASLERSVRETERRFPDAIPRPPFWGAYRLRPHLYEFWIGAVSRRHDRFVYTRDANEGWQTRRLAP